MSNRPGLRWLVIGLIALATVINYIDRNALAVMWPEVSKDIGADKADYALLVTVFMLAYAFGQALFGRIFDVIGTRMGFAVSIIIWSISIGLHAFARTLGVFAILRVTLGIGEAGNWPGAAKANALWFPARERAFAQGIFNAGASLGGIISAPFVALLFVGFGWQGTLLIIASFGFLWLLPWLWLYRSDPATHPWLSQTERAHILGGSGADDIVATAAITGYSPGFREMLGHKQSWAVIVSRFFLDPIWWLFVSWLPIYLAETFGFDVKQIGYFAWVPFVGAMIGSLSGGYMSGVLIGRGWTALNARRVMITAGGIIMMPALLLTMRAADPLTAVLLIAVVLFGFQVAINNIQTLPADYFGGGTVGSLAGISGTAAVAGTLITTWLVPELTKVSFAPIFAIAAGLVPVAVLSVWVLGGRAAPVQPKTGVIA